MKIKSYEAAQEELNEILESLENHEVNVDELVKKVERASQLLKYCEEQLRTTEKKVNSIIKELED